MIEDAFSQPASSEQGLHEVISFDKVVMQMATENIKGAGFSLAKTTPQAVLLVLQRECVVVSLRWTPRALRYPFCCRINGAIDHWATCVSHRTADHSPTAGRDTRAPISTAAARMITDVAFGLSGEESVQGLPTCLTG